MTEKEKLIKEIREQIAEHKKKRPRLYSGMSQASNMLGFSDSYLSQLIKRECTKVETLEGIKARLEEITK